MTSCVKLSRWPGYLSTSWSSEPDGALLEEVLVDRPQVVRAVGNLVRNANIHGGGVVRVRVVAADGVVEVHVEDAGPGVHPDDRERVFERFARAGGQKAGTGSGLGLSIVRQTISNHGGHVTCTSSPAGGADFTVRLPASAVSR